jgi:hypothetical protein
MHGMVAPNDAQRNALGQNPETLGDYYDQCELVFSIMLLKSKLENEKYTNTGSKDTRSGFGAGMTELGQKM